MEVPLLQTKLHMLPPRTELVPRRQLIDHLSQVQNHKLTLISAPAGFGKTTLATSWLNQQDKPVAWVSLDEADSDPTRFFTHFSPALNRLDEDILPAITDRVAEAIGQATRSLSVLLLTQPAVRWAPPAGAPGATGICS